MLKSELADKCYLLLEHAGKVRSADYLGLMGRDEYNAAALHVRDLILAGISLLKSGHHAPALFLAITSFEEIAKVRGGHSRSWGQPALDVSRGKDPLFSHKDKHAMALDPVLLIGERLKLAIGEPRTQEILSHYADGTYAALRERSLYFSRDKDGLKIPSVGITPKLTAENLLVAIEVYDDLFVGMTAEVSEAAEELNSHFSEIEQFLAEG